MTTETEQYEPKITFDVCLVHEVAVTGHESLCFYRLRHIDGKLDREHLKRIETGYAGHAWFSGGYTDAEQTREGLQEFIDALDRGPVAICEKGKDKWEVIE